MSERLELRLLGCLDLRQGGAPITDIQASKTLALLSYLTVTKRPHTRPALAGLLWGGMPEAKARGNLSKALSTLHRLLGDHLTITRQTVTFNEDSDFWLDVAKFEAGLKDSSIDNSVDNSIEALQEAVRLYQGDFLDGFYVRNAPEFENWMLAQQARLKALALQALHTLAAHFAEQDEAGRRKAVEYTTQLLWLEPWREEAHRQMMRLLALSGQRGAALAQYETCRQVLAEELDVEPGMETIALYDRIRSGELSVSGGAAEIPPLLTRPPAPLPNLPAQTTPFIGRETELAQLSKLLAEPDQRLITIVGPGGMGKTRLALELAATQLNRFEHGVHFVHLGPLASAESIIPAIAEAIHFSFYSGDRPEQQLHNYLREKRMLLVMDNYEHLLDPPSSPLGGGIEESQRKGGAKVVVDLLRAASGLKILVTSRARLNVQEEQSYSISGIDYPEEALAREIEQFSAVKLFLESARRLRPDFALTARDMAAVSRVCWLVQGMPLGLILAATWVETLSLAEIAEELERSLDFLAGNWRDLPQRQQSLRAVFDHSWRLLTAQEREVFQQMSIFRGGFTREAAGAITGVPLLILRALVNKSLLQRTPTGRYDIHELLRQYAAEKLTGQIAAEQSIKSLEPSAASHARDRHSAYYCAFLQKREADLKGGRQPQALAEIEEDGENIRAGWRWAVEQGNIERIETALESLGIYYVGRGRFQEGETAYRHAVAFLRAKELRGKRRILARILTWQGVFSRRLGHWKLTSRLYQESLALLDHPELSDQDTRLEKIFTLRQLGDVTWYSDAESGRRILEESLGLCREIGDLWGMGDVLRELSRSSFISGDLDEAKRYAEESLAIRRALDDRHGLASTLDVLCWIAGNQGRLEACEQFAREGYVLCQEAGDPASLSKGLYNLGLALNFLGQFAEAQTMFEQAWTIANELGERHHLNSLNIWLARPTLHLGQYERAGHLAQQALTLASEMGLRSHRGDALLQLGQVKIAQGAYAEAEAVLMESVAICRDLKHPLKVSWTLGPLGITVYGTGDTDRAQQYLVETLQMTGSMGIFQGLINGLVLASLLLTCRQKPEQAVEIYTLASRYPYVGNSRWFEDVVGRHITAIAETLSPEVVAAAQECGRARDLWATAEELLAEFQD